MTNKLQKIDIHINNVKKAIQERDAAKASIELINAINETENLNSPFRLDNYTKEIVILEGACTALDFELYGTKTQKSELIPNLKNT